MDPFDARRTDDKHDGRLEQRRPSQVVALFDVDRAAFRLALNVARHVGHHHLKRPPQPGQAGVDRSGAQRTPGFRSPQAEQEPVAPPGYVERGPPHLVDLESGQAVGLHQLLHSGSEVSGVVEHGLVRPPGQVGQQHPPAIAGISRQRLGQCDGQGRRTGAAWTADDVELT